MIFKKKPIEPITKESKEESFEKQDTFIISEYSKSRYQKSPYSKGELIKEGESLTNEEIEILFSNDEWKNGSIEDCSDKSNKFYYAYLKLEKYLYSYIVFPDDRCSFRDLSNYKFENCIFNSSFHDTPNEDNSENKRLIHFTSCTFIEGAFINGFHVYLKSCTYNDSSHGEILSISSVKTTIRDSHLSGSSLLSSKKETIIDNSKLGRLELVTKKTKQIDIIKSKIVDLDLKTKRLGQLRIFSSNINNIHCNSSCKVKEIAIKSTDIKSMFCYTKSINRFSISESNLSKINLNTPCKYLEIIDSSFEDGSIDTSSEKKCDIYWYGSYVKNIKIRGEYFNLKSNSITFEASDIDCKLNMRADEIEILNCHLNTLYAKGSKLLVSEVKATRLNMDFSEEILISKSEIPDKLEAPSNKLYNFSLCDTTINGHSNFKSIKVTDLLLIDNCTFKGELDLKFSRINSLGIYKSVFKKIDLDCSFNQNIRTNYIQGLDKDDKKEDISKDNFSSEKSWKYFNKNA